MVSYELHVECPECNDKDKMRIAIVGEENEEVEILCLNCEASVEADVETLAGIISGIAQKAKEDGKVGHDWIEGFIHEKMGA